MIHYTTQITASLQMTRKTWHDSLSHMCDVPHAYLWHDSFTCATWDSFIWVTWHIHICDMTYLCTISLVHKYGVTHSHVWRDSFICVTWLIHVWQDPFICLWRDVCDVTHCETGYGSFICVTWPFYICDRPHLYVCHDTFPYVAWLIHAWHDSLICMTWLFCVCLLHTCDMTRADVRLDPFICMTWLIRTCDMTYSHVWRYSFSHVTCLT